MYALSTFKAGKQNEKLSVGKKKKQKQRGKKKTTTITKSGCEVQLKKRINKLRKEIKREGENSQATQEHTKIKYQNKKGKKNRNIAQWNRVI